MLFKIGSQLFSDCNIGRLEKGDVKKSDDQIHYIIRVYYVDGKERDIDFGTTPQSEYNRNYEFDILGTHNTI